MIPTIDEITSEQWREMSREQRERFWSYWRKRGIMCFRCIGCGYPTAHGVAMCDACRDCPDIRYPPRSTIVGGASVSEDVVVKTMASAWCGISGNQPVDDSILERMRQLLAGMALATSEADSRAIMVAVALDW